MGDQIGYLGLRVPPVCPFVNARTLKIVEIMVQFPSGGGAIGLRHSEFRLKLLCREQYPGGFVVKAVER